MRHVINNGKGLEMTRVTPKGSRTLAVPLPLLGPEALDITSGTGLRRSGLPKRRGKSQVRSRPLSASFAPPIVASPPHRPLPPDTSHPHVFLWSKGRR